MTKDPGKCILLTLKSHSIYLEKTGKQILSTRELILETIKASPGAKIEMLAEAADISPVTVRHHLNGLMAEGLIEVASVRRKVGRPYYVYNLSEKGEELFPQKYFSLTNRLFDVMKEQLPAEMVQGLLEKMVERLVAEHRGRFEHLAFEDKLDYLIALLEQEGFLARWEKTEDGYKLIEYSCPYISVGQNHSEICTIDKELMLSVLGKPVNQHSCMLNGDTCCQFTVSTS